MDMKLQEGNVEDEIKRNLQDTQATYKKLLNGFMKASQDRFSKLEKSVNRIEGHMGKIMARYGSTIADPWSGATLFESLFAIDFLVTASFGRRFSGDGVGTLC
ncbi:hypothetical protein LWI28_002360 [Acer negundo]|uniref:Uncharacterized protein n=1 Tax=Acer negundo TaxID=4023 RepID=A0AAD5INT2_ACENE|nr:hypothetical protein LWI28_002360 [Acer negundo]